MLGRDFEIKPQMTAGQKIEMKFRGSVSYSIYLFFSWLYYTVFFTQSKPQGSSELTSWQPGSNLLTE